MFFFECISEKFLKNIFCFVSLVWRCLFAQGLKNSVDFCRLSIFWLTVTSFRGFDILIDRENYDLF